jgi:hypothetical protein
MNRVSRAKLSEEMKNIESASRIKNALPVFLISAGLDAGSVVFYRTSLFPDVDIPRLLRDVARQIDNGEYCDGEMVVGKDGKIAEGGV